MEREKHIERERKKALERYYKNKDEILSKKREKWSSPEMKLIKKKQNKEFNSSADGKLYRKNYYNTHRTEILAYYKDRNSKLKEEKKIEAL